MTAAREPSAKPRVLSFGPLSWSDPAVLEEFETLFEVHVSLISEF